MPYYKGDYYQGGDNYQRGDFLGLGKFVKRLAGNVIGNIPGVGAIAKTLIPSIGGRPSGMNIIVPQGVPEPGISGIVHRALPGGFSGYLRRRRINPLNIKALRRAMRRAKGFEKQAKRVGSFFSPGKTYRLKGRRARAK